VFVPKELFLVKGVGRDSNRDGSYLAALRDAKLSNYNLIKVTSIFPPHCKVIAASQGLKKLRNGQNVYVVMAQSTTDEPGRSLAAAIGLALPKSPERHGYVSQYDTVSARATDAGKHAEELAAYLLTQTLGISFDDDVRYDPSKEIWQLRNEFVETKNIAQCADSDADGLWTTTVAVAVLL